MKIHVINETWREETLMGQTVEALKSGQYEVIIHHSFGVRIVNDAPSLGFSLDGLFTIPAQFLLADTKVGDEFTVHFERVKQ